MPYLMAIICLGLLLCGLTQEFFFPSTQQTPTDMVIIKGMGFFLPVVLGVFLCTGKRGAMMTGVAYGTLGLALDLATLVQSLIGETDTVGYLLLIIISGILNFFLILFGGRGIFSDIRRSETEDE